MILKSFELMCADASPTVLGILDPSIAPPLMYYAYIPIIFVSFFLAILFVSGSRATRASKLILLTVSIFSLLLVGEILLWISAPVVLIHFVWQILVVFHVLVVVLLGYFFYSFLKKAEPPVFWKWLWVILMLPIFVLAPTPLNLPGFDLDYCESVNGSLWSYAYLLETLITAAVLVLGIKIFHSTKSTRRRGEVLALTIGTALFLLIFILSYAVSDVVLLYNINLLGPLGMVAFLATLTYLVVRFHAFNMRILGAQALVGTIIVLLFAALFVRSVENVRYVLLGTLILVFVLGAMLVNGVKREIKQREHIEELAKELEISNERQVVLIHFITHQLKGFVTKSRNIFAGLLEGDYGQIPDTAKSLVEEGFRSDTQGVNTIQEILNASNIKSGKVTYDMQPFDLKGLIDEIAGTLKPNAETKGVAFNVNTGDAPLTYTGDRGQLLNAFKNLIDNSIKYTPQGSVDVSLAETDGKIHFEIKDTGVGISPEDMKLLFTEGGHGKESTKVNVESTGFGLYIVKNIIEAHKGKVWAESEGAGKGSRFIVELPVA